jgi:hypothetical protein
MRLSVNKDATFKVEFEDGWVQMREQLTYGDRKYATDEANKAGMKLKLAESNRNGKAKEERETEATSFFSTTDFQVALLVRAIVAWSKPEEINAASICELGEEAVEHLLREQEKRNEARTKEQEGPLSPTSLQPSSAPPRTPREPSGPESLPT